MRELSATKITTFLTCALRFAYRYVEQLPCRWKPAGLAFGSAVHGALEAFHTSRMNGEVLGPDDVAAVFRVEWAAQRVQDLKFKVGEDAASLDHLGQTLVRLYVEENPDLRVRGAEIPFEVPLVDLETGEVLDDITLRGVLDVVLEGDVVRELKTSARAYDDATLGRHVQLSLYDYAFRRLYQRPPTLEVVALLKQRKPRIEYRRAVRSAEDAAWVLHLATVVAGGINAGIYPPNPGWQCGDCEFTEECRRWRGRVTTKARDSRHVEASP